MAAARQAFRPPLREAARDFCDMALSSARVDQFRWPANEVHGAPGPVEPPKAVLPSMAAADRYSTLPAPALASPRDLGRHLDLRRYVGAPPQIEQPALKESLLCMHLNRPKRIRRWRDGRTSTHDIELGALTILPALQANLWIADGPADFALIVLDPELLRQVAAEAFCGSPDRRELQDKVGFRSPVIERLFRALLTSVGRSGLVGRLYPESLLVVLTAALLRDHCVEPRESSQPPTRAMKTGGLADWRLKLVTDYMRGHIKEDIGLDDLTALAGLSRAHFFRAFKQSTALAPTVTWPPFGWTRRGCFFRTPTSAWPRSRRR